MKFTAVGLSVLIHGANAGCPYLTQNKLTGQPNPHHTPHEHKKFSHSLSLVDFDAVKQDLLDLFTSNDESWPHDFDSYGPLFVRLGWHCSGSYRKSDGRGGCDGGRQRFEPELSWADNTNLDKAKNLLLPIKQKYGDGLSFGDLYIFAATTAIESMGGPVLGFCAGRIDDNDGSASLPLGPTPEQEILVPDCNATSDGDCMVPMGTTTRGLIYVNPEGPMGQPDAYGSSSQVRDTFNRMSMNDTETVALIGGGHSFGKTHGACPDGAGPSPAEDPANPWPGNCGSGKGADTFTSGFEGPWTTNPTKWDNGEFFRNLIDFEWQAVKGPGKHYQWETNSGNAPSGVMMLTSDMSLTVDKDYLEIVKNFANENGTDFSHAFSHAWYKLTTRDMGPWARCQGSSVPPPQEFQKPLPPAPSPPVDFDDVRKSLLPVVTQGREALFVRLAFSCSQTFRQTDYQGGCNGARVLSPPESNWPMNANLNPTLELLNPVKEQFGEDLTWSDLIVLAGTSSVASVMGIETLDFCGGRSDADPDDASQQSGDWLESRLNTDLSDSLTAELVIDVFDVMGFNVSESVALIGGLHSLGSSHCLGENPTALCVINVDPSSGLADGQATANNVIDNSFFVNLANEVWVEQVSELGETKQYSNGDLVMGKLDIVLRDDSDMRKVVDGFAQDGMGFAEVFAESWVKLMNADRFDGACS